MSKSKNAIFEKNRLSEAGYLPVTQSNRNPSPDEWRGLCGSRLAACHLGVADAVYRSTRLISEPFAKVEQNVALALRKGEAQTTGTQGSSGFGKNVILCETH